MRAREAAHPRTVHAAQRPDGYARRRPEETVLYQSIAAHFPAFRERLAESGGLPKFVEKEFDVFLDCGRLEKGCLLLECRHCGYSELVAFSCKGRGFCPACLARRMADTAAHLEQCVLPEAPVRHWICSLPWGVRALLGYDSKLCAEVLARVIAELSRSLKRRAKKELGLASVEEALTGAVAAVQRVDSALRLNVHFHVLVLDGVYLRPQPNDKKTPLTFHALPAPTRAETEAIATRIADGLAALLKRHGRSLEASEAESDPTNLQLEHPALAACYDAAALGIDVSSERAGLPSLRLVSGQGGQSALSEATLPEAPIAEVRGVSLYGKQWVHGRDRKQLERLARYILRPPIASERLSERPDGNLLLAFKKPWKDGTRALVLSPQDLLARLCAAVPPAFFNMIRYYGVLASNSAFRSRVVPVPPEAPGAFEPPPTHGDQLELFAKESEATTRARRHRWAWLLGHVFQADLDTCPKCQGPMRFAAVARTETASRRLMVQQGLLPRPPPSVPPSPRGQLSLRFES